MRALLALCSPLSRWQVLGITLPGTFQLLAKPNNENFSTKRLQNGKMFVRLQANPPRMRYCRGPANLKSWLFF